MTKQRSLIKVLSVFLIAIIATLSLGNYSFASIVEDESDTSSITVEGLEAGVTAYLYKLTTVNYSYASDQPYDPVYVWVEEIQDWIEENYPDYIEEDGSVSEDFSDELTSSNTTENETVQAFYSELIAAIKGGEISGLEYCDSQTADGIATYPVDEDACTNSVEFTDLDMGTYLIIIENGYRVYTPVTVNLVPEYDEDAEEWVLNEKEVDCKSTTPQITKTVTDTELTVDNYATNDAEISYTIVTDIPTYLSNSLSTTYNISDTLATSFTLDTTSIVVYGVNGSSETVLTVNTEYTLDTTSTSFTAYFDYDEISDYEQIKITYTASLNQDSSLVIADSSTIDSDGEITGNGNTATLTYSNNPYSSTSSISQTTDEIYVYTYGIEVTKLAKSDSSALADAEYKLQDSSENDLYFVLVDGVYYLATEETSGSTSTLVTDSNGMLYLYGLDEGTYYLQETKAPEDYILDTTVTTIVIEDTDVNGLLEADGEDTTSGIYEITLYNKKGFTLPRTGGIGTTIFLIVGLIIVASGIVLIVVRRKLNKNSK